MQGLLQEVRGLVHEQIKSALAFSQFLLCLKQFSTLVFLALEIS